MKIFWKDNSGYAVLGVAFLILIFCAVAFVIYSGAAVSANYQAAEGEVRRATTVAVDECMFNTNVRDLQLDIPALDAQSALEEALTQSGWTIGESTWGRQEKGKTLYSLDSLNVRISGKTVQVDATFTMPLPWAMGNMAEVQIPMQIRESVLYIDQ